MPRIADSIRLRLLALAAVWLTVALLGAWVVIGGVLERFVTSRFDADAAAIADTLIAQVQVDDTGRAVVANGPADPRYGLPLSGWFWQVDRAGLPVAKSPSLFDMQLNPGAAPAIGATGTGPEGEALRVTTRRFTVPGVDDALTVTVTAPQAEIDAALGPVRQPLALSLVVLGLGLAAATLVQVSAGLASLTTMGRGIKAVREGRTPAMPLPRVAELRPVVAELNALVDRNATVLARSREHLGNLAHALKTPLAAMANTLPPGHPGLPLVKRMDRQIDWHLRRARSAGAGLPRGARTPVAAVIDDILLVLRHPAADRGLLVTVDCASAATFAGDRHDLEEMIGNLLDNAVKWAAARIDITVRASAGEVVVAIADDGPGMADIDHARALSRGGRLDETGAAGHGLGLAIVHDLAALNGGRLRLDRAKAGGLLAELTLPG